MPRLCKLYPGICLTTEENHGITSVRAAEKVPVGTPKITGVVDQLDWLPEELYCSGFRDVCIFFLWKTTPSTSRHMRAEFFLEWEVFQTKILSKVRHILYIKYFFPKIMLFILDHVVKYGSQTSYRWIYNTALKRPDFLGRYHVCVLYLSENKQRIVPLTT